MVTRGESPEMSDSASRSDAASIKASKAEATLPLSGAGSPLSVESNKPDRSLDLEKGQDEYEYGYDKPQGKTTVQRAGFFSSSVNMLKTIVGSGMLTLPFAFAQVGLILGISLLILAAFLSGYGLYLLSVAGDAVGRSASFSTVAQITYPRASLFFEGAIAIKCIGVAISYLLIIGQLMPQVIAGFNSSISSDSLVLSPAVWVSATVVLIAPITFMRKMDSLKYTSFLGLTAVFYLTILAVFLMCRVWIEQGFLKISQNLELLATPTMKSLRAFSLMVFAFTCHHNLFPIQNEARDNSPRGILRIVSVCLSLSFVFYGIFALCSYAVYGNSVSQNLIRTYPHDGMQFVLARLLYIFLLACSYPLQSFPCRASIEKMVAYSTSEAFMRRRATMLHIFITLSILVLTWVPALFSLPLDLALSLVGSTAGPMICYFLPAILFLKLERLRPWGIVKYMAVGLIGMGVVIVVVSLVGIFSG